MFRAKVVLDSLSPAGARLTTMEWTYPRFIHSEILTHRDRARNSASSRAIPFPKMCERVLENPVVPVKWGAEQRGMQTGDEVSTPKAASYIWLQARDDAVRHAKRLADLGVHKSLCNRLVEPFMWITVVMTATEWKNLWRLRCHPDAEVHFQKIANLAREAYEASVPALPHGVCFSEKQLDGSDHEWTEYWHLPYVTDNDFADLLHHDLFTLDQIKRVSAARCARVSYLTHDQKRDPKKDLELFDRLSEGSGFGHWSPMEHVAEALSDPRERSGPYRGWGQFRKTFDDENVEG